MHWYHYMGHVNITIDPRLNKELGGVSFIPGELILLSIIIEIK